ncbi:MAG: F0F1 ATP synthase subunit B [Ruminococcaceae bacterium]|nr:F0F1 ATP synthase subunit B [Oscillospiraceae bacterium]
MFESFIGVNFWTALFVLLNTLAIFFVAKKFLFVPVMNMIKSRQEEIDSMYLEANHAKDEAIALEAQYKEKLSLAAATGERMVKEAMERGHSREEEILRQANEEASAIMAKASADIALEKKKALNDAKDEISDIAMAIAEKVVGRELSNADHSDLVSSFIDRLGEHA